MLDPVWAFRELIPKGELRIHSPVDPPVMSPILEPTLLPSVHPGPEVSFELASQHGENVLWAVFWTMLAFTLLFMWASARVSVAKRPVYFLVRLTTTIAMLSYLAMATRYGSVNRLIVLLHEYKHNLPAVEHHVVREIFWVRHVETILTAPLILLILGMVSGLSGLQIVSSVASSVIMAFARLVASFGAERSFAKWAWYTVACVSFLKIICTYGIHGRRAAANRGSQALKYYDILGAITMDVWLAYFVIWGIGEGSRILSVDGEIYAYAIVDFVEKPVLFSALLYCLSKAPDFGVQLHGWWTDGFVGDGQLRVGDDV